MLRPQGSNDETNDDQTNHSAYNETVSKSTIHGMSFESIPFQQGIFLGFSNGWTYPTEGLMQRACQRVLFSEKDGTH